MHCIYLVLFELNWSKYTVMNIALLKRSVIKKNIQLTAVSFNALRSKLYLNKLNI